MSRLYLHIGGVRTALFNYIFAKKNQGKFLVRIEDTDKERSEEQFIEAIMEGLDWVGLNPDFEPIKPVSYTHLTLPTNC